MPIQGGVNSLSAREARAARRAAAQAAVRQRLAQAANASALVPVGPRGLAGGPAFASAVPTGGQPYVVDAFGNATPLGQFTGGAAQRALPAGMPGGPALEVTGRPLATTAANAAQQAQSAVGGLGNPTTATYARPGVSSAASMAPEQLALPRGASAAGGVADDVLAASSRATPSVASEVRAAAAAAESASPAAQAAAQAGNGLTGWRAIAARTPSPFVNGSSAATAFAPGTIGRAGLYGLGGQVLGSVFDSAVGERDGRWDDMISSGLRWGGAGAGIGSMILPGVGTAIGGALGLGVGGLIGNLTGEDSAQTQTREYMMRQTDPTMSDSLVSRMSKYGLSADTQNQILMQLDMVASAAQSPEEARTAVSNVMQQLPSLAQADLEYRRQQEQQQQAIDFQNQRAAAIQAWLGPMMQDQLSRYNQATDETQMLYMNAASKVKDPTIQAIYQANAARMGQSARQAGMGYLTMLGAAPFMNQTQYSTAYPAMTGTGYTGS